MICPHCGTETRVVSGRCGSCSGLLPPARPQVAAGVLTPLPPDVGADVTIGPGTPAADALTAPPIPPSTSKDEKDEQATRLAGAAPGAETASGGSSGPLSGGQAFGPRYHIIRLLGIGGMGAVYQAWDEELSVAVALKVIRPEVTADPAAAADLARRFKRELLLARQVTHKNVVRIHDLGEIDGIKYITMPYVQGSDLATILKQDGKLPVARALKLARQIAAGLQAAHEAGVVHRDLKPANIMVDAEDIAQIMDFGIARSTSRAGESEPQSGAGPGVAAYRPTAASETVAGAVIGTLEYMAPEQARAESVDQRADVYAFGLIFYDMLLGGRHAVGATTAIDELTQRMKEAPASPRTIDPEVPEAIDQLIARCLQPDPAARFQTSTELVAELDKLDAEGIPLPLPKRLGWRHAAAAAVLVLALLSGTFWLARTPPPVEHAPVSVLTANFDNQANDPVFEGPVEQALNLGVEGAAFITAYPRENAQRLANQIKPGAKLDENMARLISAREGIKVVLTGSIVPRGSGYSITVNAIDPANGNTLGTARTSASSKAEVLPAVGSLASKIRGVLGDATPESEKRAADETFTAASLEAARDFSVGQDLASAGKHEEAIVSYRQALQKDSNFGRAYASWATSAAILGRREESAEAYKRALSLVGRMTEREKYRTLGTYYLTTARNYEKAVENYTELVKLYPADRTGHHNLALAHFYLLDFRKALEEARRALEIYPKNETSRNNYALYAMYAGDFDTAGAEAGKVIEQNPNLAKAYLPLAMGALARGEFAAARDAYERMGKTGGFGASLGSMGLADFALYQGRFGDAVAVLKAGIASDEAAKNTAGLASKLLALAETYLEMRRTSAAVETARRALKLGQDETIVAPAARVLLHAGDEAGARALANALGQQLQPQRRAYAKVLEGEIALAERRTFDAVEAFRAALKIADVWLGRVGLGIAYVEAGHHAEALAELELAQKRRGEATAIFLDDVPSFRYVVPLYYWLARAQEALGIKAAADNYKTFLTLRPRATKNPLALDASRRAAGL